MADEALVARLIALPTAEQLDGVKCVDKYLLCFAPQHGHFQADEAGNQEYFLVGKGDNALVHYFDKLTYRFAIMSQREDLRVICRPRMARRFTSGCRLFETQRCYREHDMPDGRAHLTSTQNVVRPKDFIIRVGHG